MTPTKLLPLLVAAASAFASGYTVGETAPNFSAKDQFGQTRSLYDFQGKIVVLDFCATWCAPCQQANRDVRHLLQVLQSAHINAVYIPALLQNTQVQPASASDAEQWQLAFGAHVPVLHVDGHTGSELAQAFTNFSNTAQPAGLAFPTYVILDSHSKIKFIQKGLLTGDELKSRISTVAGVPAPTTSVLPIDFAPAALESAVKFSGVNTSMHATETSVPLPSLSATVNVTATPFGNVAASGFIMDLASAGNPGITANQPFSVTISPQQYSVKALRTPTRASLSILGQETLYDADVPFTDGGVKAAVSFPALNSLTTLPSVLDHVQVVIRFSIVQPYQTLAELRTLYLPTGTPHNVAVALDKIEASLRKFDYAAAYDTAKPILLQAPASPQIRAKWNLLVNALDQLD